MLILTLGRFSLLPALVRTMTHISRVCRGFPAGHRRMVATLTPGGRMLSTCFKLDHRKTYHHSDFAETIETADSALYTAKCQCQLCSCQCRQRSRCLMVGRAMCTPNFQMLSSRRCSVTRAFSQQSEQPVGYLCASAGRVFWRRACCAVGHGEGLWILNIVE